MSDPSPAITDPFLLPPLDEEIELRALTRSLQLAKGFNLLFVRCHQHDQRQRLVASLHKELPDLNIQEIHYREPITHLLDKLRQQINKPLPDALFVSGLEYSLPKAETAHATPFVANLNAARNSFPLVVPCPLVLWVPEYLLNAVMRGAPDFFSVRSGLYSFVVTPQESATVAESLTAGEEWAAANLPLAEKIERIAALEGLLDDYKNLPLAQRDRHVEARLLARLGNLHHTLGRWAEAEKCCQQGLAICREVGERVGEGQMIGNLGVVYKSQGRWAEAEKCYQQSLEIFREVGDRLGEGQTLGNLGNVYESQRRWAEAEDCYQQGLAIRREFGDRVGEGQTLNNIGIVYEFQGRWVEAEESYQQALAICREFGDRAGERHTFMNLGNVYGSQGRWAEAEESYQQSLAICREFGDRMGEELTLGNLGNLYGSQGRWAEAEESCQQGLAICQEFGDRMGEGQTLENLALLREAQGEIAGALAFARQAVAIYEKTEDKIALEKARALVARWRDRTSSL